MGNTTTRDLKRHVDRFGADGVMDAGKILGLELEDLIELQVHIDNHHAKSAWNPKPRFSAETRVRRYLGLDKESEATA
jgi:hypothetical protein